MKNSYYFLAITVLIALAVAIQLGSVCIANKITEKEREFGTHPEFSSSLETCIVPLNDTVSNLCYDTRYIYPEFGLGIQENDTSSIRIVQRCQLDSNRVHLNVWK